MSRVQLKNLTKKYPTGVLAVRVLDLTIDDGELFVLVGPSGCGKTTTLRLIAGLEAPTLGNIRIGESDVTHIPPHRRNVAMVFQNHVPYPHLTVRGNLEFPLKMQWMSRRERAERVAETSRLLGLEPLLNRRPAELSGGQRQRVALGRALVRAPQVFLLDEPLSQLDAQLREQTRVELKRLLQRIRTTTLYVTHDQEEALTLGDRVAVLSTGVLQQAATPGEIYHRPANRFVAGFIGSPPMNLIDDCYLEKTAAGTKLVSPFFTLGMEETNHVPLKTNLTVGIRPQNVEITDADSADVRAEVELIEPRGSDAVVRLNLIGKNAKAPFAITTRSIGEMQIGVQICLRIPSECLHFFDQESGERLAVDKYL